MGDNFVARRGEARDLQLELERRERRLRRYEHEKVELRRHDEAVSYRGQQLHVLRQEVEEQQVRRAASLRAAEDSAANMQSESYEEVRMALIELGYDGGE